MSNKLFTDSKDGHFRRFDGMTWPLPDGELAWRLVWGGPVSKADATRAASILTAYTALIHKTVKERNAIISMLRGGK